MKRAFYDVTGIIDLNGNLQITGEELREKGLDACIDSINKKTDAQGREIITYKFADKDRAADMLQRYIQMIKDPVQESKIDFKGSVNIAPETLDALTAMFHESGRGKKKPRKSRCGEGGNTE
jgi:LPS O-antigen subunit length determinant protein (WzzB/FepE family)